MPVILTCRMRDCTVSKEFDKSDVPDCWWCPRCSTVMPSSDDISEGVGAKPFLNEYQRTLRPDAGENLELEDGGRCSPDEITGKIIVHLTDDQTEQLRKLLKEHGDPQLGLRPPPTPLVPPYPTETLKALRAENNQLHMDKAECIEDITKLTKALTAIKLLSTGTRKDAYELITGIVDGAL